jgi:hypothetical protein
LFSSRGASDGYLMERSIEGGFLRAPLGLVGCPSLRQGAKGVLVPNKGWGDSDLVNPSGCRELDGKASTLSDGLRTCIKLTV